jgi:hypothetical protein
MDSGTEKPHLPRKVTYERDLFGDRVIVIEGGPFARTEMSPAQTTELGHYLIEISKTTLTTL